MALWALLFSLNVKSLPRLSSFPTAPATIFLDFDGHSVLSSAWNNGSPLVCASSGMTDAQITDAFNRVSEHYRPFNINITTDSTIFLAAPLNKRMRIIVTTTSSWYPGVGGVAYTGSFTWGDDTPGFVFSDRLAYSPKYVGECCSHESGHTLGLSHQSSYNNSCALVATYNTGTGSGETGWAPVMGNSYYKNSSGWDNGPTPYGCTNTEDNLLIISTSNGFTYRPDDYSDDPNTNPAVITIANQTFSTNGIISTNTDKDAFKLNFPQSGTLHLNATPFSADGASLDIKLTLLNSSMQTLATYNPSTSLIASIDTALNSGVYYIILQGAGNANISSYSSLGSYTISGTFSPNGTLPIKYVALTGKAEKNKHNLSWNIISDEPIKTIEVQSSTDGRFFSTIATVDTKEKGFANTPTINADILYRLKVTSVINQTVFSNIITLKSTGQAQKLFKVSTLVHNEIMINAAENYQYQLADIHGRLIETGSSNAGINTINISNMADGMYIIQMITNNQRQTERIIKQ